MTQVTLADLGVSVKRRFVSSEGDEQPAETAELTEVVFTLPRTTQVQATFTREGLGDRLLKIFREEIQTGDGIFDEAVHIKTDTSKSTESLLQSMEVRAVIESVVVKGGAVEIDGPHVTVELPGRHDTTDAASETLVRALLS